MPGAGSQFIVRSLRKLLIVNRINDLQAGRAILSVVETEVTPLKTRIGILSVTIPHTYPRGKTTYWQRAIPKDLRERYGAATVKAKLRSTGVVQMARDVAALDAAIEADWRALREAPDAVPTTVRGQAEELLAAWGLSASAAGNDDDALSAFYDVLDRKRERHANGDEAVYRESSGSEYLTPPEVDAARLLAGKAPALSAPRPLLNDALEEFLRRHKKRNQVAFCTYSRRSFAKLTEAIGNKPIEEVTRADGHAFITAMLADGLATATVRRNLNTARAVMTAYILEKEVNRSNPFAKLDIPDEGQDAEDAVPYSAEELAKTVQAAKKADDERRWIVAMLADTGARLGEVVGLTLDEIELDGATPHIVLKHQPWRRLKNDSSVRDVPLVGSALWAAKRIKATALEGQRFAFPTYNAAKKTSSNSASATLNKWVKDVVMIDHTMHDLRHTMADRLRDVQCPADVRLAIGGWTVKGEGEGYGKGYTLRVMAGWLRKVAAQ